jgi:phosphoribosylglycinamide formyltransferase 1
LTKSIGIISSGRGENLRHILMAERSGYLPANVRIVLADQPDAGALIIAREFGVPCFYVNPIGFARAEYDVELITHLESFDVEIVVLTGFMRILSPAFVNRYKNCILNIHPALLPSFRGMDAFGQALDYGAKWTGTTIHIVDEDVDHGPIIYQWPVPIKENDTHESLKARVQRAEYKAYPKAIKMFIEGQPKVVGRRLVFGKEAD